MGRVISSPTAHIGVQKAKFEVQVREEFRRCPCSSLLDSDRATLKVELSVTLQAYTNIITRHVTVYRNSIMFPKSFPFFSLKSILQLKKCTHINKCLGFARGTRDVKAEHALEAAGWCRVAPSMACFALTSRIPLVIMCLDHLSLCECIFFFF